jgi:hypothetical protein
VRLDPRALDGGVLLERGRVDPHHRRRVRRACRTYRDARHGRSRTVLARPYGHEALVEQVAPAIPGDAGRDPHAPWHAARGEERAGALDVGVGRGDVAVVPLGVREPGGHQPDPAELGGAGAQASLGLPHVRLRRVHAGGEVVHRANDQPLAGMQRTVPES